MAQAARHEGWLAKRSMKLSEEREVQGVTAIEETEGNVYTYCMFGNDAVS